MNKISETRVFRDSKGTAHSFKLKSWHYSREIAEREKKKWKDKFYQVRIIPARKNGKRIYKVFAFALWD